MKRSQRPYPRQDVSVECIEAFLISAWTNGWLDEYSDNHFLIRVIERRLNDFIGSQQLINNNLNQYNIVKNGRIDYEEFSNLFCINFSTKMNGLLQKFGEKHIKNFVMNQMSAGKRNYNENAFFEALSEISILYFLSGKGWTKYEYEPLLNHRESAKNPEARFEYINGEEQLFVNVEVKSPAFPPTTHENENIIIPVILLSENGIKLVKEYCQEIGIVYLDPRVKKLKDFLNSASSKFTKPTNDEYNILYINWSFRDFPSNSYLEAWNLLTNPINGILTNPAYAESMEVDLEFFNKVSAVVVYTESIEGLMFQSFNHVWQRNKEGPRFRMWVNTRLCESEKKIEYLFNITGMNPSKNSSYLFMCNLENHDNYDAFERLIYLISNNPL